MDSQTGAGRTNPGRRRLTVARETLRRLGALAMGGVAGGTMYEPPTQECAATSQCTVDCTVSAFVGTCTCDWSYGCTNGCPVSDQCTSTNLPC
jgi:hypothetical protein